MLPRGMNACNKCEVEVNAAVIPFAETGAEFGTRLFTHKYVAGLQDQLRKLPADSPAPTVRPSPVARAPSRMR